MNFDRHLYWTSPTINPGDPDLLDPDGSLSDMGAFGGPLADDFLIYQGDYKDYCVIDEDWWEAPGAAADIALERDTYHILQDIFILDDITIEEGTRMQFAQSGELGIWDGTYAVFGVPGGEMVVFEPIPDTDPITSWDGIWSINGVNGLELYNCEITGVVNANDPALMIWWASDAIIQGCHVHDNSAQGGI